MKYSVIEAHSEQLLSQIETNPQTQVDIFFEQEKNKVTVYEKNSHEKNSFSVIKNPKMKSFIFATALGKIELTILRGDIKSQVNGAQAASHQLKSSMPGKVLKILCQPGSIVEIGSPLLVLEAMKMENEIKSTYAGRVSKIAVTEGQSIQSSAVLLTIEKE